MTWNWLYDQEYILYTNKATLLSIAERKEFLRKKNMRKGYINKKHNLGKRVRGTKR